MLGNVALYLANRATGGAVGEVKRWAGWVAFSAFFGSLALIFGVIAAFLVLRVTPTPLCWLAGHRRDASAGRDSGQASLPPT